MFTIGVVNDGATTGGCPYEVCHEGETPSLREEYEQVPWGLSLTLVVVTCYHPYKKRTHMSNL